LRQTPEAVSARAWALAITASTVGLFVAMLFLSLSYHYVVWTHLALSGALHTMVRRHDPMWRVRFGLVDAVVVGAGALSLLAVTAAYLRLRGF
jgi:hypothetical protein